MADNYVKGLNELSKELRALGPDLARKGLRNATRAAMVPTHKKIKAAAPVGTRAHRTYKGRLVAPGFLSRNIKLSTRFNKYKGSATAKIKIHKEAFYGAVFLDEGIPGKISPRHFFLRKFNQDAEKIVREFEKQIDKQIKKLTK